MHPSVCGKLQHLPFSPERKQQNISASGWQIKFKFAWKKRKLAIIKFLKNHLKILENNPDLK